MIGFDVSDVRLEITVLDKNIERLGIKVVEKPEYSAQYQIDEAKLERELKDETAYWSSKPRQRKHDVDCLSAVFKLRKGHQTISIEDSGAVFVTANSALCKVGSRFFTSEGHTDKESVPIAVTDYVLTTLMWLKTPMSAPQLPAKTIIAECYAAVEPGERLWKKYLEAASRLMENNRITPSEYYLLRSSQLAQKELTELTFGNEGAVTEGTVEIILETVKMEIGKADREKLKEERQINEQTKKEDIAKLEEERHLREETERKLLKERAAVTKRLEILEEGIRHISRRLARIVSNAVLVIMLAIFVVGAAASFIYPLSGWLEYALRFAAIVFGGFSVYDLVFGATIRDFTSRLTIALADRFESILRRLFLPGL